MEKSFTRVSDTESHGERKTLAVRRSVYEAARYLRWKAKAVGGPKPSIAARRYVAESLVAGNKKAARFWSEVHLFIVSRGFSKGQLEITEDPGD